MSLTARTLEQAGIATVIVGSARDIVEHCQVPRFLFTDIPLGNPCGIPYDNNMQLDIVKRGLHLLQSATSPLTVTTPFHWPIENWQQVYARVDDSNREQLQQTGARRRSERAQQKDNADN